MDTTIAMGTFARENYDSVSHLHKVLLDKEQQLQKAKEDLVEAEARYQNETHLLKQEHQDKQ